MKKAAIIASAFFIVLAGVYVGVGVYFSGHYFPKTSINSVKCGNKTPEYVITKNKRKARGYILTIRDRKDSTFTIKGEDFSYAYKDSGEEEKILKGQSNFLWPLEVSKKHEYSLKSEITYDEALLQQETLKLPLFEKEYIEKPQDAYMELDEEHYEMVPEVLGNEPITEILTAEVNEAVAQGEYTITLSDNCYVKPAITSDDPSLKETAQAIEGYLATSIHYEIEGEDENLSGDDILKLIKVTKKGKVSVDPEKVAKFVQYLATKYNTYGDVREFKTTKGDKVKIGGGDYGWVINKAKEAEQIMADLAAGKEVSREPIYEQRALKSGLDDIGDTYIEIDYTKQKLWYYKEGKKKLSTNIVSGNLSHHNGSVDGVYKIVYKERNATLVGENYSSDVKYFMPFAYNIGIHDASWRSEFGKEIYKTNGSHGCVNIPAKKAEKLFSMIEVGTPVVAYYREKVKLTNTAAQVSNAFSYVKEDD